MTTSNTYKKSTCCYHADCDFLNKNDLQPCWGQVEMTHEHYDKETNDVHIVHVCQGHTFLDLNDCEYDKEII